MKLNYNLTESTIRPSSIEFYKNMVYVRKDITSREVVDNENNISILWVYQEAKLTPSEFNEYSKVLMVNNMSQLISGQENGDNNQLVIMEAIADLYETISNLTIGGTKE